MLRLQMRTLVYTTMRFRKGLLTKSVAYHADMTEVIWEWKDKAYNAVELREHRRILMQAYSRHLVDFENLEELLVAVRDTAKSRSSFCLSGRIVTDLHFSSPPNTLSWVHSP